MGENSVIMRDFAPNVLAPPPLGVGLAFAPTLGYLTRMEDFVSITRTEPTEYSGPEPKRERPNVAVEKGEDE